MIQIDKFVDGYVVDMFNGKREDALNWTLFTGIVQLLSKQEIKGGRYYFKLCWESDEELVEKKNVK